MTKRSRDNTGAGLRFCRLALIGLFLCAIVAVVGACQHEKAKIGGVEQLARSVTIYRDTYGVPHIYGPTDPSVIFGYAYARAEDEFFKVEEHFARAIGRLAELEGESGLINDYLVRAYEVERLSKEEYRRTEPRIRELCDAYVGGLNFFLATNPEVHPRLLRRFEPWFVLAGERCFWDQYILNKSGLDLRDVASVMAEIRGNTRGQDFAGGIRPSVDPSEPIFGCNAAAVSSRKSISGKPMLLLDQHQPLDADYEFHVHSDEGLDSSGICFYGYGIVPLIGHNEHLGWTFTENQVDGVDAYIESFDRTDSPLAYRYANGHRTATEWQETIGIKTAQGIERRRLSFRKTHHGPILVDKDGLQLSVRIAKIEEGGILRQLYAMNKARNLDEFKHALAMNALVNQNIVYADDQDNIFYIYNGLFPVRNPGFDWLKPVDGSTIETEWKGYHPLEERPQVLNPVSGFVQSCNNIPFTTTIGENPVASRFPSYMIVSEQDTPRAQSMRRILASQEKFDFAQWQRIPFDSYVLRAEEEIPRLTREWESLGQSDPTLAEELREAIKELGSWNRRITVDSAAATLFVMWFGEMFLPKELPPRPDSLRLQKLKEVIQSLVRDFGSWRVPYGEVFRFQRRDIRFDEPFSDEKMSLPITNGPGPAGILSNCYTWHIKGLKRRYGVLGHSYVSVVEFGNELRAKSILAFGENMDPLSPHYYDQAPFYATSQLKPAWFDLGQIRGNLHASYHPGEMHSNY
jgi:acyl-homoserine-lactone acylase